MTDTPDCLCRHAIPDWDGVTHDRRCKLAATDFAAYVFYVNRPDLLKRAVASFPDLHPELSVVDNSGDGVELGERELGAFVYEPDVPLSYTQSMNCILKDAIRRGKDFIIHFHSDATCTNPEAVSQLLEYCRRMKAENRRWGCLYTFYDILWAINPVAMQDIGGWDTNFSAYFSDNDIKRRLNLVGWETIDTGIQGIDHEGSATIRSDPKLEFLNSQTFPLHRQYYVWRWGGQPGEEKFTVPFNRPDLFKTL
jgi:hypothetical protein